MTARPGVEKHRHVAVKEPDIHVADAVTGRQWNPEKSVGDLENSLADLLLEFRVWKGNRHFMKSRFGGGDQMSWEMKP